MFVYENSTIRSENFWTHPNIRYQILWKLNIYCLKVVVVVVCSRISLMRVTPVPGWKSLFFRVLPTERQRSVVNQGISFSQLRVAVDVAICVPARGPWCNKDLLGTCCALFLRMSSRLGNGPSLAVRGQPVLFGLDQSLYHAMALWGVCCLNMIGKQIFLLLLCCCSNELEIEVCEGDLFAIVSASSISERPQWEDTHCTATLLLLSVHIGHLRDREIWASSCEVGPCLEVPLVTLDLSGNLCSRLMRWPLSA